MKTILHVLTREDDRLAERVIGAQQNAQDHSVKVFRLVDAPDFTYHGLLEAVFESDSVQVW